MFSDDVKAEAIRRLSNGRSFIMEDGDLTKISFPNDPMYQAPYAPQIEAMCEVVQKENDLAAKYAPKPKPTIEQQLENLWHDIHHNTLNTEGLFYNSLLSHLHK